MSSLTVVTAATDSRLVSLDDLKAELGITNNDKDDLLGDLLDQTSAAIESYLGRRLPVETVTEVRRDDEIPYDDQPVWLRRYPVSSITSIVADGETLQVSEYDLDGDDGSVWHVDGDGDADAWGAIRKLIITYTAGYSTIPADIQRATLDFSKSKYYSQLRDPSMRSEEIPGVIKQEFWVGQVGTEMNGIPSIIASSLDTYREVKL
jgi:hypothetical protein